MARQTRPGGGERQDTGHRSREGGRCDERAFTARIVREMLFDELVAEVGPQRYAGACEWAWQTAARTGRCGGARSWPGSLEGVPQEFGDAWWSDAASLGERLDMGLRLYREMPCYANTVALHGFYREFGAAERRRLWDAYRAALDAEDDRLADPISYSLWVDFFEDPATVEQAWRETSRRDVDPWERRLARVLEIAGPVPWALKEELFEALVPEPRWHPAILRALAGSAFDVFGALDPAAGAWLARLALPDDTPDLAALRACLAPAPTGPAVGRPPARSS